ncbi:MAG: PQQ-dependent sugar dehydrogenase [Sandaracinaceae bacterium]
MRTSCLAPLVLGTAAACTSGGAPAGVAPDVERVDRPVPTYSVTARVEGLAGGTVVLALRVEEVVEEQAVDTDGDVTFAARLPAGARPELWVRAQPQAPPRLCAVVDAGRVGPPEQAEPASVRCTAGPSACRGLFLRPAARVAFARRFTSLPRWDLEGEPESFTFTVLRQAPGDARHWYLLAREGVLWRFDNRPDVTTREVLLDIRERVAWRRDDGAVGLAFHPRFAENGFLYLQYAVEDMGARLSRFTARADGTIDPASELELLAFQRDTRLHVGGALHFGEDGMLYGSMGDGADQPEPADNAQDTFSLLGGMYRLDVDSAEPYAIPDDNPFADGGEDPGRGAPELWAWGLRNVFRWSFDPGTGEAWAGDVGQRTFEEVNLVRKGANHGWPIREGFACFPPDGSVTDCRADGLVPPVYAYGRDDGVSVTGGRVYRGAAIPELYGAYVFGDFGSRRGTAILDPYGEREVVDLGDLGLAPVDITADEDGELWFLGLPQPVIATMVPGAGLGEDVPPLLSATGCMSPDDPTEPAEAFVPYEVVSPLWSDGAAKRRWLALPEGAEVGIGPDGDLDVPVGTVAAKEFTLDGQRLETRFLLHRAPGEWVGYTYRWTSPAEARLVEAPVTAPVGGQDWLYPGPGQCLRCHTQAAGRTLGLDLRQLARDVEHGGEARPQLEVLTDAGVFGSPPDPPAVLVDPGDERAPLGARVRSYLHANCAGCHRPDHSTRAALDLRAEVPLGGTGLCDPPRLDDLGLEDARVVAPGAPERSVLLARMNSVRGERMPPLASSARDLGALQLLETWIAGLAACE